MWQFAWWRGHNSERPMPCVQRPMEVYAFVWYTTMCWLLRYDYVNVSHVPYCQDCSIVRVSLLKWLVYAVAFVGV